MTSFSHADTTTLLLRSRLEERRSRHWTHWKEIRSSCLAIVIAAKKPNSVRRPNALRRQNSKSRHRSQKRVKTMTTFDGIWYSHGIFVDLFFFFFGSPGGATRCIRSLDVWTFMKENKYMFSQDSYCKNLLSDCQDAGLL